MSDDFLRFGLFASVLVIFVIVPFIDFLKPVLLALVLIIFVILPLIGGAIALCAFLFPFTVRFAKDPKQTMHRVVLGFARYDVGLSGRIANVLFVIFLTTLLINYLGQTYRGLRFLSEYEYDKIRVLDCDPTPTPDEGLFSLFEARVATSEGDLLSFEIQTDKLSYAITRIERQRAGSKEPVKNWCDMVGHTIFVYHFDELKVAIPFDSDEPDVGVLRLFMSVFAEKLDPGYMLQIMTLLFVFWLAVAAFMSWIYALSTLDFRLKRGESEATFTYRLRSLNHLLSLLVTGTLAGGYVIGLGVALLNAMWYFESESNFLTGLGVFIGLALILFVPVPMSRGVHLLRTSRNESFALIRNVALLVGVSIPAYNMWSFAIREDKSRLDSIWGLLVQLASAHV